MRVERLRIDLAIHRIRVKLPKLGRIDVIRIENAFVQVRVGAVVVVIRREHVYLRKTGAGKAHDRCPQKDSPVHVVCQMC